MCSQVTLVWRETGLWNVIEHALSLYDEPVVVVFNIMQKLQPTQCSLFGTILWSLWKRRNLK